MEETKNYIFDVFDKYKLAAGKYIDKKWLINARAKASGNIQKYFDDVLQQMIDEDFFECKEGHGDTWFLTQKGEDSLFAYIAERNRKMNSNVNINVSPVISPTFSQTNTQDSSNTITQTQEFSQTFCLHDLISKAENLKIEL